jgi:hypothetical protein
MKYLILAGVAFLASGVATAQTRTQTFDGPRYSGERTTVRDRDAGTSSRDLEVTRKSDGAVATRSFDRPRTENGYTASGAATGFDGRSYAYSGSGQRTADGFTRNQNLRNGAGETLFNRDVTVSRANGQVNRTVNATRAEGFRPRRPLARRPR